MSATGSSLVESATNADVASFDLLNETASQDVDKAAEALSQQQIGENAAMGSALSQQSGASSSPPPAITTAQKATIQTPTVAGGTDTDEEVSQIDAEAYAISSDADKLASIASAGSPAAAAAVNAAMGAAATAVTQSEDDAAQALSQLNVGDTDGSVQASTPSGHTSGSAKISGSAKSEGKTSPSNSAASSTAANSNDAAVQQAMDNLNRALAKLQKQLERIERESSKFSYANYAAVELNSDVGRMMEQTTAMNRAPIMPQPGSQQLAHVAAQADAERDKSLASPPRATGTPSNLSASQVRTRQVPNRLAG